MCELCSGEFERIATLEVSRCAWMIQRIDPFGAFHAVIEDTNVEDRHIRYSMEHEECTEFERHFGKVFLALTYEERISALAMANNMWGCEAIPYDHPVRAKTPTHLKAFS